MFLETVRAEGLSHLSYIFGDDGVAAVIDPRRDCKVYVDIADSRGARITHIFETHCHEDFVVGSLELARRTGAKIFHGHALAFRYGTGVREGETFDLRQVCPSKSLKPRGIRRKASASRWPTTLTATVPPPFLQAIRCSSAMLAAQIFSRP